MKFRIPWPFRREKKIRVMEITGNSNKADLVIESWEFPFIVKRRATSGDPFNTVMYEKPMTDQELNEILEDPPLSTEQKTARDLYTARICNRLRQQESAFYFPEYVDEAVCSIKPVCCEGKAA